MQRHTQPVDGNTRTILLCGGGTGGHITPLIAVAEALKRHDPTCRVVYVGEKSGKFAHLAKGYQGFDGVYAVRAGKLRRYPGEPLLKRIFDFKKHLLNLRDLLSTIVGIFQSRALLRRLHPDVVLLKGGYVGVPVGLMAARMRIPIITHDSDTVPGLANKIVSRWAQLHATGMPEEFYASYPRTKTRHVGIPVAADFVPVQHVMQRTYRQQLGVESAGPMLLITGGSQGARRLNSLMRPIVIDLLEQMPTLVVVHQVGKGNEALYEQYTNKRLFVVDFLSPMYMFSGAADVAVTRGSATTLAELGSQGKAVVMVPSPYLAGGHQLANARHMARIGAAEVIEEQDLRKNPHAAAARILHLLGDEAARKQYAVSLQSVVKSNAADELAMLLLDSSAGK